MTAEAGRWRALALDNPSETPRSCHHAGRRPASAQVQDRCAGCDRCRNIAIRAGLRRQSWRRAFPFGGERNLSNNRRGRRAVPHDENRAGRCVYSGSSRPTAEQGRHVTRSLDLGHEALLGRDPDRARRAAGSAPRPAPLPAPASRRRGGPRSARSSCRALAVAQRFSACAMPAARANCARSSVALVRACPPDAACTPFWISNIVRFGEGSSRRW